MNDGGYENYEDADYITWAIPASQEFTPRSLAAFIANLIRTDPRWWYQGTWFGSSRNISVSKILDALRHGEHSCGTTGCVAGWAAILTAPAGAFISDGASVENAMGEPIGSAEFLGARALGLGQYEADYLFSAGRTQAEVLAALDSIAETGTFDVADVLDDEEGEDEDYDDDDDESCEDDE